MPSKHIFSLFYNNLSQIIEVTQSSVIKFCDQELSRRITQILRLQKDELVTLFDTHINIDMQLDAQMFLGKHQICGKIIQVNQNIELLPKITLMPCILKREAFEEVVYTAAQMGVAKIVPVISEKSQRRILDNKEITRLEKIMVAACEQAKNFVIPKLCAPINIQDIPDKFGSQNVGIMAYFDPAGRNFIQLLNVIPKEKSSELVLLFGPEGGLTDGEEKFVQNTGFATYSLTPTILRAKDAVIVGLGGVRSATNS